MDLSIVRDDQLVMLDGRPVHLPTLTLPEGVRAVQYHGGVAEVEYDDSRPNLRLEGADAAAFVQDIATAAQQQADQEDAARAAAAAAWLNSWERVRGERDQKIREVRWLIERHSDELALGRTPTLSPTQHLELLRYVQALRDVPETQKDTQPKDVVLPTAPAFSVSKTGE